MKKTMIKKLTAIIASAITAVSCGTMVSSASEAEPTATITTTTGIAGGIATVNLFLDTDDLCNGYNFDITFDKALELKSVEGAVASEVNDNVVTIINFTGTTFSDGKAVSALTFNVPENAAEGTEYSVAITNISNFTYDGMEFENPVVQSGSINVLESAKSVTNHVVYEQKVNGMTVSEIALRGDSNGDGIINILDCTTIAKDLLKPGVLKGKNLFCADINEDGKADLVDLVSLAKYMLAPDKSNAWGNIISK